jgi:hypothetical protein
MNYREARLLKMDDQVLRKEDGARLIVLEMTAFGQHKTVKLICCLHGDEQKNKLYYYHYDVDALSNEDEGSKDEIQTESPGRKDS